MESIERKNDDRDCTRTPPPLTVPVIMALPVQLSPNGTIRVPPNEHVILHRTDSGNMQALRCTTVEELETRRLDLNEEEGSSSKKRKLSPEVDDDEYLPTSLAEALAVDSGSEVDEWEEYDDLDLRLILEDEASEIVQEQDRVTERNNMLSWSENFDAFTGYEENYHEQSGPVIQETSAITIFKTIFDTKIMKMIVEQTNRYAWQTIARASENNITHGSRLNDWVDTTVEELYQFLSILMYMSLCNRGRIDEYWTTGTLGMPGFRKIMSKNRFILLSRFIHFVDNDYLVDSIRGYERKVFKIGPIVEHCNKKFAEIYIPHKALSIDESLLLWKGRLSWVQCIRTKAARFGIKSFELCEADTGYLLKFLVYTGKTKDAGQAIHGFTNATSKVVLNLAEDYLDKGHCLYMDNFYNSVGLARYLKNRRTDVVGTLNRRRLDTPPIIKNLNDRQMLRGELVATHCGDVTVLAWKDVKLVTMLSTYHKNDMAPGHRAGAECDKPVLVHDYNKHMGGVDLKDQKLSSYLIERKRGLKWYMKVFKRLLNCSILNSYIIYKCNAVNNKLDHRQFRYALAEALSLEGASKQRIRPAANTVRDRYSGNHFPGHFPEDPNKGERTNKRANVHKRGRCVNCTSKKIRKESNVICTDCKVFLCLGQCWIEYHTPSTD